MTERDAASAADLSYGTAPASNPPAASPERDEALREIAERLRAGRERQRQTVEDLATRLKVAPAKLYAVESADLGALPDMTFAKGLIRAYARALQVDVDDQLARLNARASVANIGLRPEGGLGESFSDKPSFARRRGGGRWLIGVLVAVLVAGGALAGMDKLKAWLATQTAATQSAQSGEQEAPAGDQSAPTQAVEAPAPAAAPETPAASMPTPLTPAAPAAPASGVVTAPLAPPPTLPRSDNGTAPAAAAGVVKPAVVNVDAPAPVSGPASEVPKATDQPAGNGTVSVRFSGASWYEIKDKTGKTIASGLSKEGDARELTGTPPFKVVFGNADAVESLTVGGAPIDIQKYARNRVARATLP
jgi:cytoskeleton protein RodZ